jgi:hypothetical protein
VTPTSIVIVWETDQPTDSVVKYGLTTEYGSTASDAALVTRHVITLAGLNPYTTYHYRVGTSARDLSGDNTLKTAAGPTQTSFNFVVYGDCRTGVAAHQSVVDGIISVAPDFYLNTGDLVESGALMSDWDSFFAIEKDLMSTTTLFPAIGNHEENHPNYFDFFYLPGNERWYSFDYGHAHFVSLQVDGYGDYSVGSEQYLWLEQDLAGSTQPWKFVFFHFPPYSSGDHGSDLAVRAALQPLFEKYDVDIVFSGHDHDYERSLVNGVTYLVTGGGGAPLYSQQQSNDWSIYFESTYHFVSISLDGNTLSGVGIRPDGSQFDAFTLAKYDLTVSSTAGGTVTVPGEGTFTYKAGEVVNLVATPDAGWQFAGWTGGVADAGSANTTVTMDADKTLTANFAEVLPPLGGGGGAAGITSVLYAITEDGRFTEDVIARSGDGKVRLFIPKDTIGKNRMGSLLSSIRIKEMAEPPSPPPQTTVIGPVYAIGPDGARFDPPIELTFEYDASLLPEGVAERNLYLAWWDGKAGQWVALESTVYPEDDTVTAKVSHFTPFDLLVRTSPASFAVADLSITPGELELGEGLTISVLVTNTGDLTGSYELNLKIDDMVVQTKEVTLDGGDSEVVGFSVTPDTAGEHIVDIAGLRATFVVKAPKAPAAFTTSTLSVSPAEVDIGESVMVSVIVTNTGDLAGSYEVTLKIDGMAVETRKIVLAGGGSEVVTFTSTGESAGAHTVEVDGLRGSFVVREKVAPSPPPPSIPPPAPVTPPPAPEVTPAPAPSAPGGIGWWLVTVVVILLIMGASALFFIGKWRRVKAKETGQSPGQRIKDG